MNANNETRQSPGPMYWIQRGWESDWGFFIALFFCLTVLGCFPLILHPFQHLAIKPFGDKGTNLWNLWWVYYALFERHSSPLRCDMIFIPWGCDLRYHTLSLMNGILASPVTAVFGPCAAYNLIFLAWTVFTGVFASLWAKRFNLGKAAAGLVGFIAAFGPYRWAHQVHLNLFSTPWIFLSFYLLERILERGRFRDIACFTLAWILAAFSDWYYALFVGVYLVLRAGCFVLEKKTAHHAFLAFRTMLIPTAIVYALIWFYFYQPEGASFEEGYVDPVAMKFSAYWSIDLYHLLLPIWTLSRGSTIQMNEEFCLHPGFLFLLLPGVWFFVKHQNANRWKNRFLKLALFVFILISLGPFLQIGGEVARVFTIPIMLPTAALELVPSLTVIRVFARFAYVGFLIWCLFGVMGLERFLIERNHFLSHGTFMKSMTVPALFCGVVFLIETGWKPPVVTEHRLAHDYSNDDVTPVLELPFTPSLFSGLHLYHQTIHKRPIFVAEFSRLGHYKQRYLAAFPALAVLDRLSREETISDEDKAFIETDFCQEFKRFGQVDLRISFPQLDSELASRIWKRMQETVQGCGEKENALKIYIDEPNFQ